MNLKETLRLHEIWVTSNGGKGERADLRGACLQGAYLQEASLQEANLQEAYLQGAYLQGANLRGANLQGANLREAYLRGAILYEANLQGANLREAYLQGASLQGANLEGACLRGANLQGADIENTGILTFQFNKHFAFCHEDYIHIGCKSLKIEEWINDKTGIGEREGYFPLEIEAYTGFFHLCKQVRSSKC